MGIGNVRIRLALHGCLNRPFYHIVVAHRKYKRSGKHIEQVGCYDPMPNERNEIIVGLNLDRIKYWLSVGVQPTVSVHKLLGLAGVLPPHPRLLLDASRAREEWMSELKAKTDKTESTTPEPSQSKDSVETSVHA